LVVEGINEHDLACSRDIFLVLWSGPAEDPQPAPSRPRRENPPEPATRRPLVREQPVDVVL